MQLRYAYPLFYMAPAPLRVAFAAWSGVPTGGSRDRREFFFAKNWVGVLGTWDARQEGLGGWSIDVHHTFDPSGQVVYYGDGARRSASELTPTLATVAGGGQIIDEGVPAQTASIARAQAVAAGRDGAIYFADSRVKNVRRVSPGGSVATVASLLAQAPSDVAVAANGDLYISAAFNIRRVRNGVLTTVAGTGQGGFSGDTGDATLAKLNDVRGIALGPDGSLYVADYGNQRVRRIGPDGRISTTVGGGTSVVSSTPVAATEASLGSPVDVAVAPSGALYVAAGSQILRVTTDGMITVLAGSGLTGTSGDGGSATAATLDTPRSVAVGLDGSVYVTTRDVTETADTSGGVRRISPEGIITTIVGGPNVSCAIDVFCSENVPATFGQVSALGVAVGPDGSLLVSTDSYGHDTGARILRVRRPMPGASIGDVVIPSERGTELHRFNAQGRHLATLDAQLGTALYTFGYDSQ